MYSLSKLIYLLFTFFSISNSITCSQICYCIDKAVENEPTIKSNIKNNKTEKYREPRGVNEKIPDLEASIDIWKKTVKRTSFEYKEKPLPFKSYILEDEAISGYEEFFYGLEWNFFIAAQNGCNIQTFKIFVEKEYGITDKAVIPFLHASFLLMAFDNRIHKKKEILFIENLLLTAFSYNLHSALRESAIFEFPASRFFKLFGGWNVVCVFRYAEKPQHFTLHV